MQVNAGLNEIANIPFAVNLQITIIAVITFIATASTLTGVTRGIEYLCLANEALMLAFFIRPDCRPNGRANEKFFHRRRRLRDAVRADEPCPE